MKRPMILLYMLWYCLGHLIFLHTTEAQSLPASALTANAVRQHNQQFVVVDLRSPQAFAQIRIPGSLNIPLFAVTTKTFLQGKQVLLVDDGVRPRQLADACDRLTQAGFSVRFLFGGLAAWQASGGRMQGDAFVRNSLNRLSPQAFWAAREQADWLVIDASDSPLPASREPASSIFPLIRKIPFQRDRPEQFVAALERAVAQTSPRSEWLLVLIFTRDGHEYEAIERALQPVSSAPVFFLEGGAAALTRYADRQRALTRESPQTSPASCRRCP
jgi:rhodanese-related sulfurtransferase